MQFTGCLYIGGPAAPADWFSPKVGGHLVLFLYSSREPSELSQWLCHDDSTIVVVISISIIVMFIVTGKSQLAVESRQKSSKKPTEKMKRSDNALAAEQLSTVAVDNTSSDKNCTPDQFISGHVTELLAENTALRNKV